MTRALVGLVAVAIGVALLLVVAPFLFIAALLLLLLAWKKPAAIARVSASHRLSRIPQAARSTPMRFAGSLVAATFVLTATGSR